MIHQSLTRRIFLGGASAAVALPWLPSLFRSEARAQEPPRPLRYLAFYVPNGIQAPDWKPRGAGEALELSPTMESLTPFRQDLTVISGLANAPAEDGEDGDHARGTGCFLTCTPILRSEEALGNGVSVDQLIAAAQPARTRFPSLQLGLEGGDSAGSCDAGYSCAYQRNLSWAGAATPLPKITAPSLLFARMFAGSDLTASALEAGRRRRLGKSVLDLVRAEAGEIQTRAGSADRRKLEEYFTGLRELELRVEQASAQGCVAERPGPITSPDTHARLMLDLIATAFTCDLTRVVTFMLGNSVSNQSYDFLGVRGAHHDLSHHHDDPEKLAALSTIARWIFELVASLAARLAGAREDGDRVLDRTLLYLSSELSDGNRHNHDDLPVILLGRAGGALAGGRHLAAPPRTPLARLYLSKLHLFGAPAERFGADGDRPLAGL